MRQYSIFCTQSPSPPNDWQHYGTTKLQLFTQMTRHTQPVTSLGYLAMIWGGGYVWLYASAQLDHVTSSLPSCIINRFRGYSDGNKGHVLPRSHDNKEGLSV